MRLSDRPSEHQLAKQWNSPKGDGSKVPLSSGCFALDCSSRNTFWGYGYPLRGLICSSPGSSTLSAPLALQLSSLWKFNGRFGIYSASVQRFFAYGSEDPSFNAGCHMLRAITSVFLIRLYKWTRKHSTLSLACRQTAPGLCKSP